MKKTAMILIALAMIFVLAACGKNNNDVTPTGSGNVNTPTSQGSNTDPTSTPAGQETEAAILAGTLSYLNLEDGEKPFMTGLTLNGNIAGTLAEDGGVSFNGKPKAMSDIRCIFELNEWVEFYPETTATSGIRVYLFTHREDVEFYETTFITEETEGVKAYVDLNKIEDDPDGSWGEFYLSSDECKAGYYDFIFVYGGKAKAILITKFYNEEELRNKTDAELVEIMTGVINEKR